MIKIDSLKCKAVGWHLLASLMVSITISGWILLKWFPAPFTSAAGAIFGFVIVISVDMCLGPLLTFLLIHSKKSLRENITDGMVIAVLQISALIYGLWQINLARPAAVVFWQDSFYLVKVADFVRRFDEVPDLSALSADSVPVVYARYPMVLEELKKLELSLKAGQIPYEDSTLYRPITDGLAEIKSSPVNITILLKKYIGLQAQIDQFGQQELQSDFIYSRLRSEYGDYLLVFTPEGEMMGVLTLSD